MKEIEDVFSLNKNHVNNLDFNINDEIIQASEVDNIDKQEVFDKFLTYRRRMARLAAVQALYLYDFELKKKQILSTTNIFGINDDLNVSKIYNDVIYFYKNIFFTPQEYGWTKKNKKLDETFMMDLFSKAINSISEIDGFIQEHLNGNWTTEKLDYVLRAIIRCAIAEILLGDSIEKPILCSEYTNLAGNFFGTKEVGFINGIVDKLYTSVLKIYPFFDTKTTVKVNDILDK